MIRSTPANPATQFGPLPNVAPQPTEHTCTTAAAAMRIIEQQRQSAITALTEHEAAILRSRHTILAQIRQYELTRLQGKEAHIRSGDFVKPSPEDPTMVLFGEQTFNFETEEAAREFIYRRRSESLANLQFYRMQVEREDEYFFRPELLMMMGQTQMMRRILRENRPVRDGEA